MSVTAQQDVTSITAQQGPVGGNGGVRRVVNVQERPIREIAVWVTTEFPRLRGLRLVLEGTNPMNFGDTSGTPSKDEQFDGGETFTRLTVFTTCELGGRVTGFDLYWRNDNGTSGSKRFGGEGNLAPAEFQQPTYNKLRGLVVCSGADIDALGVAWAPASGAEAV